MVKSESDYRLLSLCEQVSEKLSLTVFIVGCLVFIGWIFDIQSLKSLHPDFVTMKANTAILFILTGASLYLLQRKRSAKGTRLIAQAFAALAALIGLLTLCEYFLGSDLGIDQLFFKETQTAIGTYAPGRMGFNTALNFLLIGLSLFILGFERRNLYSLSQSLAATALLVALVAFIGYLFGAKSLLGIASYTKMALHTALAFIVICIGILCVRPDAGFMTIVTSEGIGGILVRRLIFPAIGIPLLLGWLRFIGQQAGLYGTEFGMSLNVISSIVIFMFLILWTARLLERIDAERKALKEERDLFFMLSLDLQCIAGFDGFFKQLNPAWEKTLGWGIDELMSKPYIEFVHHDDRSPTSTESQKLSSGEEVITFENRYICKDGSYRWIQWNAFPSVEKQMIYATARDVTERKKMENEIKKLNQDLKERAAQLEAANKELEAFSYSVSHDLRAPLRSMGGFSHALLEDYMDKLDDNGRDYLNRIRAASQKMGQLIDDMLLLSRITRSEMNKERVNLSALAETIAAELKMAQPERKAEFVITPGLIADGDTRLLRIAMENLLGNAWKFTGKCPEARIEFGAVEKQGRPAYFVRDNGAGFDMAYRDRLFGAFQRLHSTEEFPGTGIGLATVQRIIHRHGGEVWAEGEVGKGAAFYFTLSS